MFRGHANNDSVKIFAGNAAYLGDKASESIVFIPMGSNTITPTVDGKAQTITVNVNDQNKETIAAAMQRDLGQRLKDNVRPVFDFDHQETGPASALPKRFYASEQGIMVEVEWTGAGKKAIEAKDYSYFSPVFLLGDDGTPAGLPSNGTLGALVNNPAFRTIPRIAAADAAGHAEHKTDDKANMSEQLVKCGLLKPEEAAKDNAEVLAASRLADLREEAGKVSALSQEKEDLKKKVKALEAEAKAAKEEKADTIVKAAVADGRIAPKDEDVQAFWKESIMNGGEKSIKALEALPKQHEDVTTKKVDASGSKVTAAGGLETEAKKLVAAGEAKDFDEAVTVVAANNPELYKAYCESLSSN